MRAPGTALLFGQLAEDAYAHIRQASPQSIPECCISVHVKTALLHLGNSSIRVLHRMFNGRTGGLVASLDQFGVHLDVDARRPTAFPDALRERARAILIRPKE